MLSKTLNYLQSWFGREEDYDLAELPPLDAEEDSDSKSSIVILLANKNEELEPHFDPNNYSTDGLFFNSRAMFNVKCDYSPLNYRKFVDCIEILEKMPSTKFLTNLEWGLGITTSLAILSSPAVTWLITYLLKGMELAAMINHRLNQYESVNHIKLRSEDIFIPPDTPDVKSVFEIGIMKNHLFLLNFFVPVLTAFLTYPAFFYFLMPFRNCRTILGLQEYKLALSQYDSLQYCLAEKNPCDVEKIINMLELLKLSLENNSRSGLLEILYEIRSNYDDVYLFWKGTRNTFFFPADVYRNIFVIKEKLLIAQTETEIKDSPNII